MTTEHSSDSINLQAEVWKPVPGYEGDYEISNFGRLKGLRAVKGWKPGRIKNPLYIPQGYAYVRLFKDGKRKTCYSHRLVLLAFRPIDNPQDFDVNHINGNRADNRLENLEWLSHRDNMLYSMNILQTFKGIKGGAKSPKCTPEQVLEIRRLSDMKMTQYQIAKRFDVTQPTIHRVVNRIKPYDY